MLSARPAELAGGSLAGSRRNPVHDEHHVGAIGRPSVSRDLTAHMRELPRLPTFAVEQPHLGDFASGARREEADRASIGAEAGLTHALPACELLTVPAGPVGGPESRATLIGCLVVARHQIRDRCTIGCDLQIRHRLEAVPVLRRQSAPCLRVGGRNTDKQGSTYTQGGEDRTHGLHGWEASRCETGAAS